MDKKTFDYPSGRPESKDQWKKQTISLARLKQEGAIQVRSLRNTFARDEGKGVFTVGANTCVVVASKDALTHIAADADPTSSSVLSILENFAGQSIEVFGMPESQLFAQVKDALATRGSKDMVVHSLPSSDESFTVIVRNNEIFWSLDIPIDKMRNLRE